MTLTPKQRYTQRYRDTKRGYLTEKYIAMRTRVEGRGPCRVNHLYEGLPICTKKEFIEWALEDNEFHRLWDQYRQNNRELKYAIAIDRIDSDKGYVMNNMQFLTHSENATKSNNKRWGNT